MIVEDISAFFADFGQATTVAGQAVTAIFDNAYALSGVGIGMAASLPRLTCASADLPASPVGSAVVIGADTYTVAEHHADGTGISTLLLEATA